MPGAFTTTTTLPPVSGGDLSIPGTAATVITSPVGVGGVTSIDGKTGSVSLTGDYAPLADAPLTGAPTVNGHPVVTTDDARLADQRTPTDASVTLAKLAAGVAGTGLDIPLPLAPTLTAASAPVITTTQPYDATAGTLAPTLPALSGLSVGQRVAVQKSAIDTSPNKVTLTCAAADTFDSGATTLDLRATGELRELSVVSLSGTKKWKVSGGNTPLTAVLVENVNTVPASGATVTLPDPLVRSMSDVTLTAACTITFPTAAAGKSFTLVLRQDGTGGRLVTWPGSVKWPAGGAPTLSTALGAVDVLSFFCVDGASWLGGVAGFSYA